MSNGVRRGSVKSSLKNRFDTLFLKDSDLKKSRVINANTPPIVAASYKMLRTRLLHRMRTNDWRLMAITSASPQDGKTLTAINLAVSLADEGNQNVFLIDLDMRNPSVNKYLAVNHERSIVDYFSDSDSRIEDFIYCPPDTNLFIIGNSEAGIQNSSELIFSARMEELLSELKEIDRTALFIFDLPPILLADDMLAFAPYADSVLFVVGEEHTSREQLAKANEMIKSTDLQMAGVVLNRSVEASRTAYY